MSPEQAILRALISCVPQWYVGNSGTIAYSIKCGSESQGFYSPRKLTPKLGRILDFIESKSGSWLKRFPGYPTPAFLGSIREDIAVEWLKLHSKSVQWIKFLAYAQSLRFRTYENQAISRNLVIVSDSAGGQDISDADIQKTLDPLAGHRNTYFRVNHGLEFVAFQEALYREMPEPETFRFYPDFLHAFASSLKKDEFSLHVTSKGDVIILHGNGMIASQRRGEWYIYDNGTFKNSLMDCMGISYMLARNLYGLMFDLSYRRHGALLVYDPLSRVLPMIVNQETIITPESSPDAAHYMLCSTAYRLGLGNRAFSDRSEKLILELASMDGALVFNDSNILAFGAMIKTHDRASGFSGARSTAAKSAFLHGGKPIKVSSDGDISILFSRTADDAVSECDELRFM